MNSCWSDIESWQYDVHRHRTDSCVLLHTSVWRRARTVLARGIGVAAAEVRARSDVFLLLFFSHLLSLLFPGLSEARSHTRCTVVSTYLRSNRPRHSIAYFFGKDLSMLPQILLAPLVYCIVFLNITSPRGSFGDYYLVNAPPPVCGCVYVSTPTPSLSLSLSLSLPPLSPSSSLFLSLALRLLPSLTQIPIELSIVSLHLPRYVLVLYRVSVALMPTHA